MTASAPEAGTSTPDDDARDALAGRLFEALIGTFDLLSVQLGIELGLYAALRDGGPATPPELASRAGIDARYAREWLEQQAVTGILDVDDSAATRGRRYTPVGGSRGRRARPGRPRDDDPDRAGDAQRRRGMAGAPRRLPNRGRGPLERVPAHLRGPGGGEPARVPAPPHPGVAPRHPRRRCPAAGGRCPGRRCRLRRRLVDGRDRARVPGAEVHGLDLDAEAIGRARDKARDEGLEDRVRFHVVDAGDNSLDGTFDLVTIFEAVHDMSRPVEVLESCRRLLAPGGTVIVVDEKVAERFTVPGDTIERLMYGYSVFVCLANGLAESPSAGRAP